MNKRFLHPRVIGVATVISFLTVFLFGPETAQAIPNPTSGPSTGGTVVTIAGLTFTQVESGNSHSIGLTNDGHVFAWGQNFYGQLGNGLNTDSTTPVQVLGIGGGQPLSGVTSIAANGDDSFAIVNGEILAWGRDNYGQLGDGTNNNSSTPVKTKGLSGAGYLQGVTQVSAARDYVLALAAGNVYAWGRNLSGQLGNGTLITTNVPVQVSGIGGSGVLSSVTQIAAGEGTGLALIGGQVAAWGANTNGELGNANSPNRSTVPVQVLAPGQTIGGSPLTGVTAIGASPSSYAIAGGHVLAWGYNTFGELCDGTTTHRNVPVEMLGIGGVGLLTGVTSIKPKAYNFAALANGQLVTCGSNVYGQLGDGTTNQSTFPVVVLAPGEVAGGTPLANVTDFNSGTSARAIVNGAILGWGWNGSGGLGNGTYDDSIVPVLGPNFQPARVVFGSNIGASLTASGNVWSVVSPAGVAGVTNLSAVANVFGGTLPGVPSSVSWDAGTFTYEIVLANTGTSNPVPLIVGSSIAVLLGVGLLIALRRQKRK